MSLLRPTAPLQLVGDVAPDGPTDAERRQRDIAAERAHGANRAFEFMLAGKPGRALYELARSAERQKRIETGAEIRLQPTCPCGGRCPNGRSS